MDIKYNASLKFWKANVTCKWQRKRSVKPNSLIIYQNERDHRPMKQVCEFNS